MKFAALLVMFAAIGGMAQTQDLSKRHLFHVVTAGKKDVPCRARSNDCTATDFYVTGYIKKGHRVDYGLFCHQEYDLQHESIEACADQTDDVGQDPFVAVVGGQINFWLYDGCPNSRVAPPFVYLCFDIRSAKQHIQQ